MIGLDKSASGRTRHLSNEFLDWIKSRSARRLVPARRSYLRQASSTMLRGQRRKEMLSLSREAWTSGRIKYISFRQRFVNFREKHR